MDFNDIKKTWKDSLKADHYLDKDEIKGKLKIKSDSNTALNKVKRNYKIELLAGTIIALLFIVWIYLNLSKDYKYIIAGFTILFFGVLISITWRSYRRIKNAVISSDQLKPALEKTIRDIERYVDFNRSNFSKYLIMPFAICFGMIVGLLVGAGDEPLKNIFTINEIIKLVAALVILSGIFIPFSQFMTRKMYKQHLDELKYCLKEFEDINE